MRHEPAIICQGCGFKNDTDSTSCYGCGLPLNDEVSLPAIEQGWPSGFRDRLDTNIIDFLLQLPILIIIIFPLLGISMEGYFTTEGIFTFTPARFISIALLIALNVLYGTLLVGTFATTTGKLMLQTDVLRSDGSRVGYSRALIRELAKILSGIMLGIGFLMIAFRSDKRGLHDLISDTMVIRRWDLPLQDDTLDVEEELSTSSELSPELLEEFSELPLELLALSASSELVEFSKLHPELLPPELRAPISPEELQSALDWQISRRKRILRIGLFALMLLVFAGLLMFIVQR